MVNLSDIISQVQNRDCERVSWLVLGVGNGFRRDDGIGGHIAGLLSARGWVAQAVDGDGATLMTLWEGRAAVMVIDATRSGAAPGSLRVIDAVREELPPDLGFFNSHAFGVAAAVETARALGKLPPRLFIIGVEGAEFGWGEGLSPPVAAVIDELLDTVERIGVSVP